MISSVYAALSAALYIGLSVHVIRGRRLHTIALGDKGNINMQTRIRAHANFGEYTPFFLLLLALADYQGLPAYGVHILGIAFLAGRLSHAYGILIAEPVHKRLLPRMLGMMATFGCLGSLSAVLLWQNL